MFCLCSKEPRESTSMRSQSHTASPSAPVHIGVPRLPAPHLLAEPSTPPGAVFLPALQSGADPTVYLIPRIPEFEGLVDPDTDSDDGPPHMTGAGTALHSSGLLTPKSARGSIKTSTSSPLSVLKNRMEALRHFPSSDSARCHAFGAAIDNDDCAVVARRAEVRRIAHKMIQEELQKEQHPQSTHVYRKTAMSTIREDPSDVASSCGGPRHDVKSCCNKNVKKGGQYEMIENAEFGCSHVPGGQDEGALKTLEAAKSPRYFQLKSPTRVSLPRGFKIGGRFRGAVGEKRWRRAVLVTTGSQQGSEVATLDGGTATSALPLQTASPNGSPRDVDGKKPSVSCESCFVAKLGSTSPKGNPANTAAPPGQATSTTGGKCSALSTEKDSLLCPDPISATRHASSSSGSLGSLDEDGSVHEAHAAHIVAADSPIPCVGVDTGVDQPLAVPDDPGLRSSCLLCIAASVNLQHAKHRSGPSVASHISTLNLPSPVVGPDSMIDGENQQTSNSANHNLTTSRSFLPVKIGSVDSKSFLQAIPRRGGSTGFPFQFRSLSRLGMTKGSKGLESDTDIRSSAPSKIFRSRSTDTQRFPESWWKATPDTLAEPVQCTDRNTSNSGEGHQAQSDSPDRGDTVVVPEKLANEQSGLLLSSSRAMSASLEKVFKMGIDKLTSRKSSFVMSQPQNELIPASCNQGNDSHASDATLRSVSNLQEAEARSIARQSASRASTSSSLSRNHDDMISDIDSVFGVLISVNNGQEKEEAQPLRNTSTSTNTNANTVTDKDKPWPPLTAPSTPVSNAYAEVRAYIITNFSENTATASARRAVESSGASDLCESVSHHDSDKPFQSLVPVSNSDVKNGDSISIKSDSAHILRKQGASLPPAKYMTWNGPTRVQQRPMRSTLEFSSEPERVLQGEKENAELLAG